MPSDREKALANLAKVNADLEADRARDPNWPNFNRDDKEIAQARAEGFRDGIERAAAFMDERFPRDPLNATTRPNATAMIRGLEGLPPLLFGDAIRALAPVPDSSDDDPLQRKPLVTSRATGRVVRTVQRPPLELPDEAGAKATDPRGSGRSGGGDAAEAVDSLTAHEEGELRMNQRGRYIGPAILRKVWAMLDAARRERIRLSAENNIYRDKIDALAHDELQARTALRQIVNVLGPATTTCEGCRAEMTEALRLANAVVSEPEPSTPPLGSTPPAGATLSPLTHDLPGSQYLSGQPERSGGEGK